MAKLAEAKVVADKMRRQLAELDKLTGRDDFRQADKNRKRAEQLLRQEIIVPPCKDRGRRERLELDDEAWLMWYFGKESGVGDPFWYEFTSQQKIMIRAIRRAIKFGGDQAIAASRGEGKTTLAERLLVKYTLQGVLSFSVLCASTGPMAEYSLETIKTAFRENENLFDDYPEVCVPVRALENAPQRASGQRVTGDRHDNGEHYELAESRFSWCGREVILPNVPGSPSAGAIIATRGLDAAVRGMKINGKRPQLIVIDDPDTEDTARSEEQAEKLVKRIDRALGGTGGQQRGVARIMLTTLQSRICASYIFTDPLQKSTFKGLRFRYLIQPPERMDLWDEYVAMRQQNMQAGDEFARGAHSFYLEHRETMDAGSIVANRNRFDGSILPDGSALEVSSLERYYNEVARIGAEAVATEYDNDPPEEFGPIESGITASKIQLRLSGYPARVVPPNCIMVTQGIDVQKSGLHFVVRAWMSDATSYVIEYGVHDTHGTKVGSEDGVEFAVRRAILERIDVCKSNPYCKPDGEVVEIKTTLVDSGWKSPAVYQACAEIGLGIYPSKGHGKSHGCATMTFTPHVTRDVSTKPGDGWYMKKQPKESLGVWLVHCDTDRWKAFEHERWMTEPGKPGAAYLFGDMTEEERRYLDKRLPREAKEHHSYAHHLTAEREVEEVVRGQLKRYWKIKAGRVQNHYLDASYLSDVAGSMNGISLFKKAASTIDPNDPSTWPSLNQLAKGA